MPVAIAKEANGAGSANAAKDAAQAVLCKAHAEKLAALTVPMPFIASVVGNKNRDPSLRQGFNISVKRAPTWTKRLPLKPVLRYGMVPTF